MENIQIQSFEAELPIPQIADEEGGPPTFRAVFIRAPAILEVGPEVVVLADIPVSSSKAVNPESTEVWYMLLIFSVQPILHEHHFSISFVYKYSHFDT